MRIDSVAFKNYCQLADREDTLTSGLVGIVGKNGAGKSNFIRGILRGITGKASTGSGELVDDVRWGVEPPQGSLKLGLTHGSRSIIIQRDLHRSAASITNPGSKKKEVSGVANVNAAIQEMLRVNDRVLHEIVFVEQGSMEGILFELPAERMRSLSALFGTGDAERIREYLHIERNSILLDSKASQIQAKKAELNLLLKQIQEHERLLSHAQAMMLTEAEAKRLSELIARREAQVRAVAAAQQSQTEIERCTAELTQTRSQLSKLRQSTQLCADIVAELTDSARKANELAERDKLYKHSDSMRQHLILEIDACEQVLAKSAPRDPGISREALDAHKARLDWLRGQLSVSGQIVNAIAGKPECPTCKQPITAEHVEWHRKNHETLTAEFMQLDPNVALQLRQLWDFEHDTKRWQQEQSAAKQRQDGARAQLDKLGSAVPVDPAALKEAQENLQLFSEASAEYAKAKHSEDVAKERERTLMTALDRARGIHEGMVSSLGEPVSEGDYTTAQSRLQLHARAAAEYNQSTGTLNTLNEQRAQQEQLIAQWELEEANLNKLKTWAGMVERARALLAKDQLPAIVANAFLQDINASLSKYLEMFEVPFTARITTDQVICSFSSRRSAPAKRLSGGQKVMLGLAFRFAVSDQFASQLGLMVLDEPTVFLDDDHVDIVVELLTRVKSYAKGKGMQLLVVTHERRLTSVFDQIIEV